MLRLFIVVAFFSQCAIPASAFFMENTTFHYEVSVKNPAEHRLKVDLTIKGWGGDSLLLKLPKWTPGYYQLLDYADKLSDFTLHSANVKYKQVEKNSWVISNTRGKTISLQYDIIGDKKFVAQSYVDSAHAYLLPGSLFLYVPGKLNIPVYITVNGMAHWNGVATGLQRVLGRRNVFYAENVDVLYDSPILAGVLTEIPAFQVGSVPHRFIGYNMGDFDQRDFVNKLQRLVTAATDIIGDIPYKEYTFIAIGPGRGGIEHTNNTTISFDGSQLRAPESQLRLFHFLAHEYFHHYNVKRIRPFELGPFDYDGMARTNLLWVSEGLSVYYEYLVVRRAGLSSDKDILASLAKNIQAFENSPGKNVQSLIQASYETWREGPFGKNEGEDAKTISYYDKGPVVGFVLDIFIRHATRNEKSLDDVMRYLYNYYYKALQRGFTDAEFQQACESVAGVSLKKVFEYVYTARDLEYDAFLAYAGLTLERRIDPTSGKIVVFLQEMPIRDEMQEHIWRGITGQ